MHIAILTISAFGTLLALFTLPEPVRIPLWIHGGLLLISIALAVTRFGSKEMLTWCASGALTIYWAVVQLTGAPLASVAQTVGFSPKIFYMLLYTPLAIIMCLGLFVAAHIIHDRQATTPAYYEGKKHDGQNLNDMIGSLRSIVGRMTNRQMKDRSKKPEIEYIDFVIGEIISRK